MDFAELLKQAVASGGIGGLMGMAVIILGYLFFCKWWNKAQIDSGKIWDKMREDRKFMEDRLTHIIGADQASREANTRAMTNLTEVTDESKKATCEMVQLLIKINGRLSK